MSLWNKKQIKYRNRSPLNCTRTISSFNQETSLCICHKASLTIEASIIIPLVAGFLISILFFFRVIQVQVIVDEALMYVGKVIAVRSSICSSDEELLLQAEEMLYSALYENAKIKEYVEGGIWGISLRDSEITKETICLEAEYEMSLPILFFGTQTISLYSQNELYKWNGNQASAENESWVYITASGEVYHATANCRVLDLSIKEGMKNQIGNMRGKDGQKYYPCSACEAKECASAVVYYTDYGRLYHADVSCRALKRTIIKIPVSDVEEREACSYCYPY